MKSYDVIGYAFEGDVYCVECILNPPECDCVNHDANGICENNCHGYGPNPIFACDADSDDVCTDCGTPLLED